ncbi:DUF4817 domain-containing protein [Trichonephila clavipes]|nr:DUF4817 domain-containing protein [Trichonephila clavipes]
MALELVSNSSNLHPTPTERLQAFTLLKFISPLCTGSLVAPGLFYARHEYLTIITWVMWPPVNPEKQSRVVIIYTSKMKLQQHEERRETMSDKGPLLPQALKRMIARFEKTGHLGIQPGRGRKLTRSDVVEDVATAIVDQSMDNVIDCSNE